LGRVLVKDDGVLGENERIVDFLLSLGSIVTPAFYFVEDVRFCEG
jgi:hypothetical protein